MTLKAPDTASVFDFFDSLKKLVEADDSVALSSLRMDIVEGHDIVDLFEKPAIIEE